MAEMLSIVQQLLVAGNETTTKLLTETMRLLGGEPARVGAVARTDPGRAPAVVEETLAPVDADPGHVPHRHPRRTSSTASHIPKGARLVIVFASANRDESLYDDPDDFDPDRDNLRDHLAFGKGIHFCLGAALSRLEGKVALEELSRRLDSFSLAEGNEFRYFASFLLRGLTRLDLDITPRSNA